jgi:hypothetical protein
VKFGCEVLGEGGCADFRHYEREETGWKLSARAADIYAKNS